MNGSKLDVSKKLGKSNGQYKSIIKKFTHSEFGYSKMGRCVISIEPKSEAERLCVQVGWLEKSVQRAKRPPQHKRRRKRLSKTVKAWVHFLVPLKPIYYKALWRALASTHYKLDHPSRKIVGSVQLGTMLEVMDVIGNRAQVRCPISGWDHHDLGWLPEQAYAWVSIKSKDGRLILHPVEETRSLMINSNVPKSLFGARSIVSMQNRYLGRSSRQQFERARSLNLSGNSMTDPDLLETKMAEPFFSSWKSRNPNSGRRFSKDYARSAVSFTKMKEGQSRKFIKLNFNDVSKIPCRKKPAKLRNFIHIPLNFSEIPQTKKVDTKDLNSVPRNNSKISLTRSKTFSNQFTPGAENRIKNPSLEEAEANHCLPEQRSSDSEKQASPRKGQPGLRKKLSSGDEQLKTVQGKNQSSLIGRKSLILPVSKLQTEEVKMHSNSKSSSYTILTPTSVESKLRSKSVVQSEQEDDKSKLARKNRRLEGMREIAAYQKWLAQGLESPVVFPEDPCLKTPKDEGFRRTLRFHNMEKRYRSTHLDKEPGGVKKEPSELGKLRSGEGVFLRPSKGLDNRRTESRGFNVDNDSRDGLLYTADV